MQTQPAWPTCRVTGGGAYLSKEDDGTIRCSECGELLIPANKRPARDESSKAVVVPDAMVKESLPSLLSF
ncbi:MAG: hypothetical protein KGI38_06010 [Thaumarchaeota archaeon]|nr:hypothetical protein [Nitrososphaerota archaeon]